MGTKWKMGISAIQWELFFPQKETFEQEKQCSLPRSASGRTLPPISGFYTAKLVNKALTKLGTCR